MAKRKIVSKEEKQKRLKVKGRGRPVQVLFEQARERFLEDYIYGNDYMLLSEYFTKYRQNNDKQVVLSKVRLIDLMYRTNLIMHKNEFSLAEVADVILNIHNIDERLKAGCRELPGVIAKGIIKMQEGKGVKPFNFFSFATKYCCLNNDLCYGRDDYSIYDSFVVECLPVCYEENKLGEFEQQKVTQELLKGWKNQKDYVSFAKCIDNALDRLGVIKEPHCRRNFDHLLWCVGNGMFDPKTSEEQPEK